ncbi:beta-ketoacyl-ACP synthase III [Armatimonas sp.]|uniref:beta-ketoacyl-ACP synthase III n=1 Tax=Armatimonas sp. TaxID=1872638 RepID=UPI00286A7937|nr:beta-ketoacyl-ACP synthase III [Armatimonas sp.]
MRTLRRATIAGIGKYTPERVLTNDELSKLVDTNDEWIVQRTGIRERRIAAANEATSDMATKAAQEALDRAGITAAQLDVIVVATCTPDFNNFPATAMLVQNALGAPRTTAFDISVACAGFAHGLDVGAQFVETGRAKNVLVIGAEKMSSVVNWEDRSTCILFGDAAGAVLLQPSDDESGLLASDLGADGSGACLLNLPAGGSRHPMTPELLAGKENTAHMDGKAVFKFGVKVMGETALKALNRAGMTENDVDMLVPHQANIRIIQAAAERMGLVESDGSLSHKVAVNIDRYGNTSAASVPLALYEAWQDGRVVEGNIVVTIGFGAGLAWGANVIRWGKLKP